MENCPYTWPGAATPGAITHSLTIRGADHVWSILEGERHEDTGEILASKNIENRSFRIAPGWYALIYGKGSKGVTTERYNECQARLPDMTLPPPDTPYLERMRGSAVGAVRISHSLPIEDCADSPWATGPVCNIIAEVGWFHTPEPCAGGIGAAPIKDQEALARIQHYANNSKVDGWLYRTYAEEVYTYNRDTWRKRKRTACEGCIDVTDKDEQSRLAQHLSSAIENMKNGTTNCAGSS